MTGFFVALWAAGILFFLFLAVGTLARLANAAERLADWYEAYGKAAGE